MNKTDMNEFANKIRKEYFKDWRNKNKDKVKDYNSKYWKKRAEKIKTSSSRPK